MMMFLLLYSFKEFFSFTHRRRRCWKDCNSRSGRHEHCRLSLLFCFLAMQNDDDVFVALLLQRVLLVHPQAEKVLEGLQQSQRKTRAFLKKGNKHFLVELTFGFTNTSIEHFVGLSNVLECR
uniref:Uncharacterized protein n=1 Tax=Meloidogyne incognita TaxID=6306 RepID=A0A914MJ24_MELIC